MFFTKISDGVAIGALGRNDVSLEPFALQISTPHVVRRRHIATDKSFKAKADIC
jgi:hypothetical protein